MSKNVTTSKLSPLDAIETRYAGNMRSGRIIARCKSWTLEVEYQSLLSIEDNHRYAARQLARKIDCPGHYAMGKTKSGFVFVNVAREETTK